MLCKYQVNTPCSYTAVWKVTGVSPDRLELRLLFLFTCGMWESELSCGDCQSDQQSQLFAVFSHWGQPDFHLNSSSTIITLSKLCWTFMWKTLCKWEQLSSVVSENWGKTGHGDIPLVKVTKKVETDTKEAEELVLVKIWSLSFLLLS